MSTSVGGLYDTIARTPLIGMWVSALSRLQSETPLRLDSRLGPFGPDVAHPGLLPL